MEEERFTPSGIPLKPFYGPQDMASTDYATSIGDPGQYPFARGIYSTMYRRQPWAILENTGFDLASDTRKRSQLYIQEGAKHYFQRGSIHLVFDLTTLYGYDSDHPGIAYEIGKNGVHINSLRDMEELFAGVDLENTHVSFVPYAVSAPILAMFLAMAENRGVSWDSLSGAIDNCPLLGPLGENMLLFSYPGTLRLMVEVLRFGVQHLPRFNLLVIPTYSVRERGGHAVHELAIGLAMARQVLEEAQRVGIGPSEMAPRMLFFLSVDNHFFEEVAKLRALRKLWAHIMREEFGVADPATAALRLYVMPGGSTLHAQQPLNNIVRCAIHGLAGVMGGVQVMGMPAYDEALGIPTEEAGCLAVRTQLILQNEMGLTDVADPLGGSYYVESLTKQLEVEIRKYLEKIDRLGGFVAAVDDLCQELDSQALKVQQEVTRGKRVIVGVNQFSSEQETTPEVFRYDSATPIRAQGRIEALRQQRDGARVKASLDALWKALQDGAPVMLPLVEAARAYATLGEMVAVLRETLGEYAGQGL